EMSAGPVIVREVAGQDAAEVPFAEDENVIQTLATDRADEPLGERILPRASGGGEDFLDLHALHTLAEGITVDGIAIAEGIGGGGGVREGVHGLVRGPGRGGMLGDVECRIRRRWWARTIRTKSTRKPAVGTVKKSMKTRPWTWLVRNVREL